MKIQVENYYGNDILTLNYHQKDVVINKTDMATVEFIANKYGYNVANIDTDENGYQYIRVQEVNINNTQLQGEALLDMVNVLNVEYLYDKSFDKYSFND